MEQKMSKERERNKASGRSAEADQVMEEIDRRMRENVDALLDTSEERRQEMESPEEDEDILEIGVNDSMMDTQEIAESIFYGRKKSIDARAERRSDQSDAEKRSKDVQESTTGQIREACSITMTFTFARTSQKRSYSECCPYCSLSKEKKIRP